MVYCATPPRPPPILPPRSLPTLPPRFCRALWANRKCVGKPDTAHVLRPFMQGGYRTLHGEL